MAVSLNLGNWNQVFAVPTNLVDEHLRLASGNYLKILLLLLRHAGEPLELAEISSRLGLSVGEVTDGIAYWKQAGLIQEIAGVLLPQDEAPAEPTPLSAKESAPLEAALLSSRKGQPKEAPSLRRSLPPRPTIQEVNNRRLESPELCLIFQQAEQICSRLLTQADLKDLCWFYDCLGLPADVILMLLHFCKGRGKTDTAYLAKVAVDWWTKEIIDHDRAKEHITRWEQSMQAQGMVTRIFGIGQRRLTAKEGEYISHWTQELGYGEGMIRLAYEESVNAIGQLRFSHINSILNRWHAAGLQDEDDVTQDKQTHQNKRTATAKQPSAKQSKKQSQLDLTSLNDAFYNN